MINSSLHNAPPRGRFFLAAGLGVTLLTSSALAQISPNADAAAPGSDSAASRNTRAAGVESQGRADQPAPDRVIITGSFIPTAEGEGALPVATFTQDDLRKLGATSAVEGLRRLPSFVGNAATENNSNGGTGSASINLRALGPENTLVLINGHRVNAFTDINAMPFGAIDHIEVLKDGASATYGSDAVAGVVNFVLKNTYEGAQVDFQYGNTTNNDNSTYRASVITGFASKDKRFNIVLNANYYQAEAIFARDRFLSSVADARRFGGTNTESPTYPGRVSVSGAAATALGFAAAQSQLTLQNDVVSNVVPTRPADYRVFDANGLGDGFNFRDQTPAIPKQQRFAYYGATDYQVVKDLVDVYAYGLYSNNRQYNALASAPFPLGSLDIDPQLNPGLADQFNGANGSAPGERNLIRVSPFNPFAGSGLPGGAGGANALSTVRYRTFELGPRASLYDTRFYNLSGGVKGLFKTFTYDAFLTHDEFKQVRTDSGDARRSVILAETAAGNFNPFIGASAPQAGTVTNANGTFSYDNAAALQRASYIADTVTFTNLNLAELRLTNTFFPDAPQGGVSVALTGEYRRESLDTQSDPVQLSGDQLGFNAGPSYHAVQDVRSVAGELNFPIVVPTMNIPFIYNLAFTVAGRYQKFFLNGTDPNTFIDTKSTFETTNPKYAVRFQPIQDVTLRASYSTAFRAPSLGDLFAGGGQDFPVLNDPFGQSPLGQNYQPALGNPTGGNPNLQPETTDAYTAGIVLTPRFLKGFTMTVDYYQLNQSNLILPGSTVAQLIVDQNFATSNKAFFAPGVANAFNDPGASFANLIRRDPADGTIQSVDERGLNAARRNIEGIDVTAFYELNTMDMFKRDFGKFNFTFAYNHFLRFKAQTLAGQPFDDFNGNFNNSGLTPGSVPFNKGLTTVEYTKDIPALGILPASNIGFITTVNYIGDYIDQPGSNRGVREYTTVDLQLNYVVKAPEAIEATTASKDGKSYKGGGKTASTPGYSPSIASRLLGGTTLTLGVVNLADKSPPFSAGRLNDNYDTALYSIRNRFVYAGFSKKF